MRNRGGTDDSDSSCSTSGPTYGNSGSLAMTICMAARKTKKDASTSKSYNHKSLHYTPNWICY